MATRKTRKEKADPRLRAKVKVGLNPDGSPIYKWVAATTAKELERKKAEIVQRYLAGYDSASMTLGDYLVNKWFPVRTAGATPSRITTLSSTCNTNILPVLGSRYIRTITKDELLQLLQGLQSKGRSQSLINTTAMVLREVFGSAQADGVIQINPAYGLKAPSSNASPLKRRALTEAETAATLAVIETSSHGLFLLLLYYFGLRRGEALGLRWEDVDFDAHCIHVRRDIDYSMGRDGIVGKLKTESSARTVPIPEAAENRLRAARGIGWVFSRPDGNPYSENDFTRMWRAIRLELAEQEPSIESEGLRSILTPHYYRHNYATILHRAKVPVEQARDWLGHSSIAITLDIYTHLDAEDRTEAAATLAKVFG